MKASLSRRPAPVVGTGATFVLDCPHGTTTGYFLPAPTGDVGEDDIVRLLLVRHFDEQGCRCPAHLWRRYGMELQAVAVPAFSRN